MEKTNPFHAVENLSPGPKLGDLIPQKKQLMFTVNAKKITHVLCEKGLTYLT